MTPSKSIILSKMMADFGSCTRDYGHVLTSEERKREFEVQEIPMLNDTFTLIENNWGVNFRTWVELTRKRDGEIFCDWTVEMTSANGKYMVFDGTPDWDVNPSRRRILYSMAVGHTGNSLWDAAMVVFRMIGRHQKSLYASGNDWYRIYNIPHFETLDELKMKMELRGSQNNETVVVKCHRVD